MRAPMLTAVIALAVAGCSSGTRTIIVVQERPTSPGILRPAPAPAPAITTAPAPSAVAPLEVALGRPSGGKLFVQTNRAAYVAIFEIVPGQGVVLGHPSALKQSAMTLSGISSIPVSWDSPPGERRVSSTGRAMRPTRYLYAIASEKPLRIPDAAFHPGYLEQVLGPGLFRAPTPQATTQALARHFAPAPVEGRWAQDMYTMSPADETAPYRVARIYCKGGTVYEVPENIAGRAWCPTPTESSPREGRGRGVAQATVNTSSPAPDSVVGHDGRRVGRVIGAQGRGVGPAVREDARPATPTAANPTPRATPDPRRGDRATTPASPPRDHERVEKERVEKERVEKERVEKERVANEGAAQKRAEHERMEKERVEKERVEKERVANEGAAQKRAEHERMEKERVERESRERVARDDAEREQSAAAERLKRERDTAARDSAENERAEAEKAAKAKAEKEEARKAENDKAATAKADKEAAEKEKADKGKSDNEKSDNEKSDNEKSDNEKSDKEKAEKEKSDKDKADKDKADRDKADKDKADAEVEAKGKASDKAKVKPPTQGGPPAEAQ